MDPLGGVRSGLSQGRASAKGIKNKMKMAKAAKAKTARFDKPVIGHLLLFLLIGTLLGAAVMIPVYAWPEISVAKYMFIGFVLVFLLVGMWHRSRMFRKIDWAHPVRFWPEFWLTFSSGLLCALALFLMFHFIPKLSFASHWQNTGDYGLTMASAAVAFLFPFLFMQLFEASEDLQEKKYPLWYYPKDYIEKQPTWDFDKIVFVNMVFATDAKNKRFERHEVKLPLEANFGETIYLFIQHYNQNVRPDKPFQDMSMPDNSLGWMFGVDKKLGPIKLGTRFIDPELTVEENRIGGDVNITWKRVNKPVDNE